jgi:hypothetical protein
MYSQFVLTLKFLQLLGYVGSFIIAINCSYSTYNGMDFLIRVGLLCFCNYIITQTPIAIVDILNRIEINTRNLEDL